MPAKKEEPAPVKAKAKAKKEKEVPVLSPAEMASADFTNALGLIDRGITAGESRFISRALKALPKFRRRLEAADLGKAIQKRMGDSELATKLLAYIEGAAPMETGDAGEAVAPTAVFEVSMFLQMVVVMRLIDGGDAAKAAECSRDMITSIRTAPSRASACDEIVAKCFFYFARSFELLGKANEVRGDLHAALRTASLRSDEPSQAVLLNLLIRNYISADLIDQAARLVDKTVFPESAPNSEAARNLYYNGRIEAIQLEYSDAHQNILLAIRKAPKTAIGFLQTANKLGVIVQMLLGEIPDREVFRQPNTKRSLAPYFQLTQAVRMGNVKKFNEVLEKFGAKFREDKNFSLILRLRHNVIKTGVRMVNVSYSRVSLEDVAKKLELDTPEDAEYIVMKAIRDGVVDATINHEEKYVSSNENVDIYSTSEPHDAYHQRIDFCLRLHNDLVKSMRYPPNAYRRYLETPEQRAERDREATEIMEELDEEEDGL